MTQKLTVGLGVLVAAMAISAGQARPAPEPLNPAESADTRYCMKVGPLTGSLVETTRCWTRQQWAEQGVDLDKEWPKEGVGILRRS